jgi:hypothetical protein
MSSSTTGNVQCSNCDNCATCIGKYESMHNFEPACDD